MADKHLQPSPVDGNPSRRGFIKTSLKIAALPVAIGATTGAALASPVARLYLEHRKAKAEWERHPMHTEIGDPVADGLFDKMRDIEQRLVETPCEGITDLALKASLIHIMEDLFNHDMAASFQKDFDRFVPDLIAI